MKIINFFRRQYYKWLLNQLRRTLEIDYNYHSESRNFEKTVMDEYKRVLARLRQVEP